MLATGYSSFQNTSLIGAPKTDASLVGDLNCCVTSFQLTSELHEKINQPKFSCHGTGHQTKMAGGMIPITPIPGPLMKFILCLTLLSFPL